MIQPPRNSQDQKPNQTDPPPGPQFRLPRWVWPALWLILLAWIFLRLPEMVSGVTSEPQIEVPYSEFYNQVVANNVDRVVMQGNQVRGVFKSPVTWPPRTQAEQEGVAARTSNRFVATLLPVDDPQLPAILREHNVTIVSQISETSPILLFLLNFGPILLLLGFFIWSARRTQGQMGNVFGFGRTQAREYTVERPKVTFSDVAGQEAAKSELVEIVDFLKEPDKYIALGARIPRGVLLVGPPGTGKTLMARAVAGEANVAFFSIAASEFVEMFVGVGASRVRDLFKRAKDAAPSIVFIDEIDAVGRQRGAGLGGGHDEREQTLNQLLAEMDGFDQTESVIVMAATNRPDVLDPALLRPGRFDRQVTVGLPDKNGRLDILKIHTKGKPLSEDVSLESLAKATIGFSGADLSNLANEAALTAARRNAKRIAMRDFLDAFDRIVLGTESPPLSNEHERQVVAYHEAGHAIVGALTPGADPVFKVTIVPRGQALGVTASLPDDDRRNYSREYLVGKMMVLLGGRAAEEITFNEVTTGASNDLRRVTDIARRMVSEFGMSRTFGLLNYGDNDHQPFLGYSLSQGRSYSEETAARIDEEVKRLVDEAYAQTLGLLENNRDKLETLAKDLLENEVVDGTRVLEIVGLAVPEDTLEGVTAPDTHTG
ncbi:MAG: ATP-dependent metallopeptidase FtsH/Yme1/Tma family protein [Chloroflexi bacterium]|nr:ATP-dependent metallopeptidase FtsH/Yme1/Tma family protein [Chloroflexota bacterium]MDL1883055.1 ATP-dependent zinc metalloprotease FtsH [Anaerolineae bacterium CFX8]